MVHLSIYEPNSVLIPDDSPVQKIIPLFSEYAPSDQEFVDSNTLFYDIFLDPISNRLIGLGPALLNLKKDLFPMTISCNGLTLKHKLDQIKGILFLRSEPLSQPRLSPFPIELSFKTFDQTLVIDPSVEKKSTSRPTENRLTLTTLQKENPLPWISDWLLWHHRKFGVQRLVLYDNNSKNRDALLALLKSMPIQMEIVFVDWKFPYSHRPHLYCQLGSLNHCRMRFPVYQGYCINLDIDEYLMHNTTNLLSYLDSHLRYPAPGAVIMSEYLIPNISTESNLNLVRCFNFRYRATDYGYGNSGRMWNKFGRTKYIYSFDNLGFNSNHSTDSGKNSSFSKRYSTRAKLVYILKKILWEVTKKFVRFRYQKPRIDAIYSQQSELCFFHFQGLNTGWKYGPPKQVSFDPEIHKIEPRIANMATVIENSNSNE